MAHTTRNLERKEAEPRPQGPASIPVLPVRDTVLFPHAVLPLTVGRESSVQVNPPFVVLTIRPEALPSQPTSESLK